MDYCVHGDGPIFCLRSELEGDAVNITSVAFNHQKYPLLILGWVNFNQINVTLKKHTSHEIRTPDYQVKDSFS